VPASTNDRRKTKNPVRQRTVPIDLNLRTRILPAFGKTRHAIACGTVTVTLH
jgi:hypothetical protein